MKNYFDETLEMITKKKLEIAEKFENECVRLLGSGALDKNSHSRAVLFGVALENIADGYRDNSKEWKNLRHF